MPSVQFPHNTWDSSLHPQNGPQLSQWCSYSIIKLVNLTEHCAVTKVGWRTCSMHASSKRSVGSHCILRGQWHQTIIPHVEQNFQEIGPPALGTGGPIFLGLCGPPDQSFCQTKTSMIPHADHNFPASDYHTILAINCVHAWNWFTHLQPTWQIDGQNDNSVLTVMEFPKFLPDKNFRDRKQKAAWHCIYMYSDSVTMPSAEFTRNTRVSSVHP